MGLEDTAMLCLIIIRTVGVSRPITVYIILHHERQKRIAIEATSTAEGASKVQGMPERSVLLDGCSKAFAMTGWRLGYGLFPEALLEPARNLAINSWT